MTPPPSSRLSAPPSSRLFVERVRPSHLRNLYRSLCQILSPHLSMILSLFISSGFASGFVEAGYHLQKSETEEKVAQEQLTAKETSLQEVIDRRAMMSRVVPQIQAVDSSPEDKRVAGDRFEEVKKRGSTYLSSYNVIGDKIFDTFDYGEWVFQLHYYAEKLQDKTYYPTRIDLFQHLTTLKEDRAKVDAIMNNHALSSTEKLLEIKAIAKERMKYFHPHANSITAITEYSTGDCFSINRYLWAIISPHQAKLLKPGERFALALSADHEKIVITGRDQNGTYIIDIDRPEKKEYKWVANIHSIVRLMTKDINSQQMSTLLYPYNVKGSSAVKPKHGEATHSLNKPDNDGSPYSEDARGGVQQWHLTAERLEAASLQVSAEKQKDKPASASPEALAAPSERPTAGVIELSLTTLKDEVIKEAQDFKRKGQYREAIRSYEKLGDDKEGRLGKAETMMEWGDLQGAMQELQATAKQLGKAKDFSQLEQMAKHGQLSEAETYRLISNYLNTGTIKFSSARELTMLELIPSLSEVKKIIFNGEPLSLAKTHFSLLKKLPTIESISFVGCAINFTDLKELQSLNNQLTSLTISQVTFNHQATVDWSWLGGFTRLTNLNLKFMTSVNDISFAKNMPNLADLDLSYTGVISLKPLSATNNLKILNLEGTRVLDLSPLSGKPLEQLIINDTAITDHTPIGTFANLRELQATNGHLTSLEFLRNNNQLALLILSDNPITDLSPLSGKPISDLTVNNTKIGDSSISILATIATLNRLSASGCLSIRNIDPLADTPNLEFLDITDTTIDRLPFAKHAKLKTLYFEKTLIRSFRGLPQSIQEIAFTYGASGIGREATTNLVISLQSVGNYQFMKLTRIISSQPLPKDIYTVFLDNGREVSSREQAN